MRKTTFIKLNLIAVLSVVAILAYAKNTSAISTISIAIPATIDMAINPSSNTAALATNNLSISTTGTAGFRILINSENTTLNNIHHSETIPSITNKTSLANFPTNTWGVYLGGSTPTKNSVFMPISTTPVEIIHNELANASGTYKLAIGVKADTTLPAGTYRNDIIISVVATPPEATSLADATYMQDITPEICANSKIWASEADSATLTDKRDGKTYKVARLKDGNCWMQENLAIDLTTSKPLTSNDSDITPNEDGSTRSWLPEETQNKTYTYNGYQYYNWDLATAGSGKAILDQESITVSNNAAPDSICAKNWKLPLSGKNNDAVSGSFQNMIKWYGIALRVAPVSSSQVGFFEANGKLQVYGDDAYYWSRNAAGYIDIYNFYYGTGIESSNRNAYTKVFTVRCEVTSAE